ncbi:hypothetical protein D3C72_1140770 [compost metagenome]
MRKVGKGDDAEAAHARGLAQHDLGIAQVLQRVDLQHHVEGGVVEHRQAFVEVELDHVDAAADALQHVAVGDLHAVAGAAALALQQVEQGAVAAAQVEHARALRHELGDQSLVCKVAHWNSLATRSKYERTTPM